MTSTTTSAERAVGERAAAEQAAAERAAASAAIREAATAAPAPSGTLHDPSARSLAGTADNRAYPVRFDGVSKTFGAGSAARTVLARINLTVAAGEVTAILGPSGCGKSTLLRAAAGLGPASGGQVLIDGSPVTGIDPRCAVAFQEPRLLPWRSVRDNVLLGVPKGIPKREARDLVDQLLALVGLDRCADARPREISGGMAQRASLARALARNPGVLLLDEPFGALDALTRIKMQDLLLDIHAARPTTILLVTHDVDEALQLGDRVVVLGRDDRHGPAGITQVLDVPGARPRDRASAQLAELRGEIYTLLGVEAHHTRT